VKSGYAVAVALRDPVASPVVVSRQVIALSDPSDASTKQPYHHNFSTHEEDAQEIARRVGIVKRFAARSVAALVEELARPKDRGPLRAALVVGSVIDPTRVGNAHIRAHASEGQLFRTVLEDVLRAHGVACEVIVEKQLATEAASRLRRRDGDIKKTVAAFGREIGGSWRADDKAASAAAWIALSSVRPDRV
jgi:hypothetical protein